MRPLGRLLLALLLVGCAGETPEPEGVEDPGVRWQRYMDAGRRWEESGSPDAAALYYERAVGVARKLPQPDLRLAQARFELGDALRRQAYLAEAEQELKAALDALEPLPERHPELEARILDALGYVQMASGDAGTASYTLARSLKIHVDELGGEDVATAETLVNLAEAHQRNEEYEEAITLLLDAGNLYAQLGPDYRIRVATVHDNLGRIYGKLDRNERAEALHLRAIELGRQVQAQDNPNVAIFQRNLANLYMEEGREAEAEVLYRESLATLEKSLGPEHYETRAARVMLDRHFPEEEEASP